MTHLRKSRFWLLTTAALIFGSHMSAAAQVPNSYQSNTFQTGNYNAGAPTMVAAAPSLPDISAEQIARDVTAEFNPRTGRTELIAAPFDPFEADPYMAGSLRLRSAEGAVTIDGHPLPSGAIVDIDFYYNSPSDDPYGGRNYSEVSFVNGDLAPVVLRDSRILECSARVDNIVYDHNVYYAPSFSNIGIYQPSRYYAGHSSFGFGFGANYFGPGIGFFNNNITRFNRTNFNQFGSNQFGFNRNNARTFIPRTNLPNAGIRTRRNLGGGRFRRGRNGGRTTSVVTPATPAVVPGTSSSNLTAGEIQRRVAGRRAPATDLRKGGRLGPRRSITGRDRVVGGVAPNTLDSRSTGAESSDTDEARRNTTRRVFNRRASLRGLSSRARPERIIPKQNVSTPVISKQAEPRAVVLKQRASSPAQSRSKSPTQSKAPSKKSKSSKQSKTPKQSKAPKRSKAKSRSSSRSSSSSRRSSARTSRPSTRKSSSSSRRRLNFYPNSGYGGRNVVTSQSVECAREDKLSIFIPNDRLDSVRFDGLTLIAVDAQGVEAPIYIPTNYIQGYRLAATGQVQPQGLARVPQSQIPQSQLPLQQQQPFQGQRPLIEAAPCPVGTNRQPDGTCLQTTLSGYPAR